MYVEKYYPNLYFEAHKNLWLTCLYLGQMSMKHLPKNEAKQALIIISKTMKELPLSTSEINNLPFSKKIWGLLSSISVSATCKIRNILNIGF